MEFTAIMKGIIILVAVVIFLLGFIFRDDNDVNDKGYNRDEKVDWKRNVKKNTAYDRSARPSSVPPSRSQPQTSARKPSVSNGPRVSSPSPSPHAGTGNANDWSFLDRLSYDEDLVGDTMDSEIAGLRYYCNTDDVGPVRGIITPEPSNVHDPRAKAVIRNDGKLIGYLPRTDIDEYELLNEDHLSMVCPFAGNITVNSLGWLESEIRIALPESKQFVIDELEDYI